MGLLDRLNADLKEAMKAKDQAALRSIRAIKAQIMLANTDGSGKEVDDAKILSIVQKLIKQRKDSLEIYEQQGREDLAVIEREEVEVISKYLPEQLSDEALRDKIKEIIATVGAESMRDMGKVMGVANKELSGKADGKAMAAVVKEILG